MLIILTFQPKGSGSIADVANNSAVRSGSAS